MCGQLITEHENKVQLQYKVNYTDKSIRLDGAGTSDVLHNTSQLGHKLTNLVLIFIDNSEQTEWWKDKLNLINTFKIHHK